MDWIQTFTIIGILGGLFGIFSTIILWQIGTIHQDIGRATTRLDGHASRIDQLYQMFCEMQKEIKDLYQKGK